MGLTYLEGLGENLAWSIGYRNEGHLSSHKRDGLAAQLWGRVNVLDRHLSLSAGAGPYLYYDTRVPSVGSDYTNDHGVGAMFSLAATWYTASRLLFQARANWIWTSQNFNSYSYTFGIGYQLEKPPKPGPLTGASAQAKRTDTNEVTVFGGTSVLNALSDTYAAAGSVEYRRGLARYFDWTIGMLTEAHPASRTGLLTELWAVRAFFDDHLSLGFGAGPYLAQDRGGENTTTKVNWLVSATASYRFGEHWAVRSTWHRVTTTYNRDADVVLLGVGYRF